MKKSELRKIIRQNIKQIISEDKEVRYGACSTRKEFLGDEIGPNQCGNSTCTKDSDCKGERCYCNFNREGWPPRGSSGYKTLPELPSGEDGKRGEMGMMDDEMMGESLYGTEIEEAQTVGLGKNNSGCPKNFQCKKHSDCAKFNDKECGNHECQGGCCMRGCDYPKKGAGSNKKNIKEQNINTQQFLSQFSCPAWSGFSNWVNNFTSLPNFTSTNPNQPCQFLCQRFTLWNNQVQTAGPVWSQQLRCKLRVTAQLKSIYNCNNSQAPAC